MQFASLSRAKIQTPSFRSGLIERSELEQQLGDALANRRLVLLVAPAGYGKTAALSRQLQRLPAGCAVAWLTLDEEDDLQRLLSHLIEALEPLDPPWRLAPEALLELVAQGRLREAASALLGALEATDAPVGAVIVLDDLHAVADARAFEFLGHLLDGLPQNWTLAIASRVEPPLALGRWRARREVAEFDETTLGFSQKEVQDLWRHATGQDDPERAERLHERTHGWAAGLCLGLETSEVSAASAPKGIWHNRRHLFEYLATEVLEDLPDELQAFLLRCSLLAELTVPRCEQISGNPRAARLLEDIERRRLFVSVLDSEELTLRLHDLFRNFLEERLRRLHSEEVPALLRLAAQGEAEPVRRTLMYLRAGAWDEAQRSLGDASADMLAGDKGAQVIRVIEQFPTDIQARSPFLAYVRGLCAWSQYQYATVRSNMELAAAGFQALGRHDDTQHARAMQALAMFFCGETDDARILSQAVRAQPMDLETEAVSELLYFWYEGQRGPADGPGNRLAKVVDLLARRDSAELWFRCMPRLIALVSRPGVSAQIQRLIDGARAAAAEADWSLQAGVNLTEAWLLTSQGRLAELQAVVQRIEEDSRWLGQPAGFRLGMLTLKITYQMICDDREGVGATHDAIAAQLSFLGRSGELALTYLTLAMRSSAGVGDWTAVRRHLPLFRAEGSRADPRMQVILQTFEAQLAMEEGRTREGLTTLRDLVANPVLLEATFLDAAVRARLALAELADGSPTAGWRALEPLIKRVELGGEIGHALTAGVQVLAELSNAKWDGAASKEGLDALRRGVELARRFKAGPHEKPRSPAAQQDAGLSGRELEVLALLTQGQSNKLIARALDLSPHTVKRHVARILDRLDLASRMQAANWYRTHVGR
jgi:LuxR family transcriptional regulator, maltose regulon positive regulatory protein